MPHVSKREFLEEANRRLSLHPDYRQGMQFLPFPKESTPEKAIGYATVPEGLYNQDPFDEIIDAMSSDGWAVDPLPGDVAYTS
jgi:hypothetical protein